MASKVGYITGGARGLGYVFAKRLLRDGLLRHATIVDIDGVEVERAAAELCLEYGKGAAAGFRVDVTDSVALERSMRGTLEREGSLDLVVNNAGVATGLLENLEFAIDLNLTAVIQGTRIAATLASEQESLRESFGPLVIVNVASAAGLGPVPFAPVYAATKAGVVNFSRSCSPMLGPVRVNALCPSFARTRMVTEHEGTIDDAIKFWGGLMEPEQVADALVHIVKDKDMVSEAVLVSPRGISIPSRKNKPKL